MPQALVEKLAGLGEMTHAVVQPYRPARDDILCSIAVDVVDDGFDGTHAALQTLAAVDEPTAAMAAASPMAIPTALSRRPWPTTSLKMRVGVAPKAVRIRTMVASTT
jgi:hypothetical protein